MCDVCGHIGDERLQICRKGSEGSSRPQYYLDKANYVASEAVSLCYECQQRQNEVKKVPSPMIVCCLGHKLGDVDIAKAMPHSGRKARKRPRQNHWRQRAQQPNQVMPSEGNLALPEEMVAEDYNAGNSAGIGAGRNPCSDRQILREEGGRGQSSSVSAERPTIKLFGVTISIGPAGEPEPPQPDVVASDGIGRP